MGRYEDTKQWIMRPSAATAADIAEDTVDKITVHPESPIEARNWRYHLTNNHF